MKRQHESSTTLPEAHKIFLGSPSKVLNTTHSSVGTTAIQGLLLYSQIESNYHLQFRKLLLYPLSYGSNCLLSQAGRQSLLTLKSNTMKKD